MPDEPDWMLLIQEISNYFGTQPRLSLPGPMRMSGRDRRAWSWHAVKLVIDHVDAQANKDPMWHVTVEITTKLTYEYASNQELDLDTLRRFLQLVDILPGPCNEEKDIG